MQYTDKLITVWETKFFRYKTELELYVDSKAINMIDW